jgi:hypothetical protein
MPLRNDIDFCCLALNGPRLEVPGTTELLAEFSVTDSTAHIDLDFWREWLGSLQTRTFTESSLVITAEHYDRYEAGASHETRERIEHRVRLFHFALVLIGCGYNSSALMVGGNTAHGHTHLGPIQVGLTPCQHPRYRRPKRVSGDDLRLATTILKSLEHVYAQVPKPDYRRIRKGFNSWIRGVESDDVAQGLHSFVRAAEAIIRPTTSRKIKHPTSGRKFWRPITPTFLDRGQTFVGRSTRSERLLKQLYELRSCVEHTKNIEPAVRRPKDVSRQDAFLFRTLQAEILASTIYTRIFTNDALREQLRTESGVEGFWRRSEDKRLSLFGEPIDLHAAAQAQFLSSRIDAMDLI